MLWEVEWQFPKLGHYDALGRCPENDVRWTPQN